MKSVNLTEVNWFNKGDWNIKYETQITLWVRILETD